MKMIFEKWWHNDTKVFQIINYKKAWKENGIKPMIAVHENGGRRKNGDKCFDMHLIIGYMIFSYTNHKLN